MDPRITQRCDLNSPGQQSTEEVGPYISNLALSTALPNLEREVAIRQGLIHGDYNRETNRVELHVKKGKGVTLLRDMLIVAENLDEPMKKRQQNGGPRGKFILHPTGAAIVKIVVQVLGEALGEEQWIAQARESREKRKREESKQEKSEEKEEKSEEFLHKDFHDEHFQYLTGLQGKTDIEIRVPIPPENAAEFNPETLKNNPEEIARLNEYTERKTAEFTQNILEKTPEGMARFKAYIKTVEKEKTGVSLDVTIYHDQLAEITKFLRKNIPPQPTFWQRLFGHKE
jgi:hypothetical protein